MNDGFEKCVLATQDVSFFEGMITQHWPKEVIQQKPAGGSNELASGG